MNSYIAAAIQMNSQPDLNYNLEQAYQSIREAKSKGAMLVGLPENFAFLGDFDSRIEMTDKISEEVSSFLKKTAAEFEIYLLGGGYPVPADNGKVYNRSQLFSPDGKLIASYNKIHLFDVDLPEGESYRESDFVQPGEVEPVVASVDTIGMIGLTICYDLRFPELYRQLSDLNVEVISIPSAFTDTTGMVHWKSLLRARAIENTAFVFAPAQTGIHGENRKTYGHSMIIDPWGTILADGGRETGVITAQIDRSRIREVRQRIPSLEHRTIH